MEAAAGWIPLTHWFTTAGPFLEKILSEVQAWGSIAPTTKRRKKKGNAWTEGVKRNPPPPLIPRNYSESGSLQVSPHRTHFSTGLGARGCPAKRNTVTNCVLKDQKPTSCHESAIIRSRDGPRSCQTPGNVPKTLLSRRTQCYAPASIQGPQCHSVHTEELCEVQK